MLISFLFLDENICCGYSLEAPRRGASNEYPQHMFSSRNKKNIMWIPSLICSYEAWLITNPCKVKKKANHHRQTERQMDNVKTQTQFAGVTIIHDQLIVFWTWAVLCLGLKHYGTRVALYFLFWGTFRNSGGHRLITDKSWSGMKPTARNPMTGPKTETKILTHSKTNMFLTLLIWGVYRLAPVSSD